MFAQKIVGLLFFENKQGQAETANTERYKHILEKTFVTLSRPPGLSVSARGTTVHTAKLKWFC